VSSVGLMCWVLGSGRVTLSERRIPGQDAGIKKRV
jgi:hypothetical protein